MARYVSIRWISWLLLLACLQDSRAVEFPWLTAGGRGGARPLVERAAAQDSLPITPNHARDLKKTKGMFKRYGRKSKKAAAQTLIPTAAPVTTAPSTSAAPSTSSAPSQAPTLTTLAPTKTGKKKQQESKSSKTSSQLRGGGMMFRMKKSTKKVVGGYNGSSSTTSAAPTIAVQNRGKKTSTPVALPVSSSSIAAQTFDLKSTKSNPTPLADIFVASPEKNGKRTQRRRQQQQESFAESLQQQDWTNHV
eukprot:CAMPEP_0172472508 /NCGR_PEP_ID=MMETSP1065-20121228/68375_1 /TAXON_ID=265537 /ORGANISM="Amphiprora paludosa, Strain CCMP125" /LENGTH=248 /DNA_ID=CAMNT_0013230649 /DNA_START=1 /DNA_END=747 /DNA_ORIENTATION=-